jgi:hypothetical protein
MLRDTVTGATKIMDDDGRIYDNDMLDTAAAALERAWAKGIFSLLPLDVGFDPRLTPDGVILPRGQRLSVTVHLRDEDQTYVDAWSRTYPHHFHDRHPDRVTIATHRDAVTLHLRNLGFRVVAGEQ